MYQFACRARIAASFFSGLLAMSLFAQPASAIDFIAPQIQHQMSKDGVIPGSDHVVTAEVTDDTRVDSVILHFRQKGERRFSSMVMKSADGSSRYEARIVGQTINDAGIEYFFEAADSSGNAIEMYGSNGDPFAVSVVKREVAKVDRADRFTLKLPDTEPRATAPVAVRPNSSGSASALANANAGSANTPARAEGSSPLGLLTPLRTRTLVVNSAPVETVPVATTVPTSTRSFGSASVNTQPLMPAKKKSSQRSWLWVGLGVLVAALIAGAAGGSGSTDAGPKVGDLDISTPVPAN